MIELLRRWIVPSACLICVGAAAPGTVCDGCRASLPWNRIACPVCALPQRSAIAHVCANCAAEPPHFDATLAAFRYEAPIAQAIAGLKYHAQFRQSRWLGAEIARLAAERTSALPDLLIPVPLHPSRLRERGYNQALELARGITRQLAIDIDWQSAVRLRATADQIGKRARERRKEVRKAFAVGAAVAGRHIALIDDVMTTGSTVDDLARAARAAGAARIEVWVAARVP
ncbi:ComF family protein [Nevskia sp.]|uniref:ComF family protein n=1 Tax=Nevskia sp. TaxID=1929292 RepID=UPI0025EBED03|nr:ComF family protein [Nevskia sp.]